MGALFVSSGISELGTAPNRTTSPSLYIETSERCAVRQCVDYTERVIEGASVLGFDLTARNNDARHDPFC